MNGKTAKFIRRIAASFTKGHERSAHVWKRRWRAASARERAHLRRTWAFERGVPLTTT